MGAMSSLFYSCTPEEQRGQATSPMSQSEGTETPPTPFRIYSGQPNKDRLLQVWSLLFWA